MNTSYWRNKIMDDMFQASSGNVFYIGLSSTTPTTAGGNVTEPAGNGYERVQITGFSQANNGVISNTSAIMFPRSTGTWFPANALATHWVLFDGADANAHVLSAGALETPIGIWKNTEVTIATGEITITLADGVM